MDKDTVILDVGVGAESLKVRTLLKIREGETYFGNFRTTMIYGVIAKTDETTRLHNFAAQDTDCFHAITSCH